MTALSPGWYNAIPVRCSRRSYDKTRPIEKDIKDKLHASCSDFRPYSSARVEFIAEPPDDIFSRALGFYGNIKNARSFLAFIGDMSDGNVQEKMGYTGEGIILEATSLGLGTCWVALTYRSKSALSMLKLKDGEKLLTVSPVGYTTEAWTVRRKRVLSFRRQPKTQAPGRHGQRPQQLTSAAVGGESRGSSTPGSLGHQQAAVGLPYRVRQHNSFDKRQQPAVQRIQAAGLRDRYAAH